MSDSREPPPIVVCVRLTFAQEESWMVPDLADFCMGRIMDGSRTCSFSFPKQKCSPIEFLFISSSIDRGGAIISSHPPFCAEGEGEVSLFPFSMGLFAVHNGLFSKWKTAHFKILEITLKKNQHTAKSQQSLLFLPASPLHPQAFNLCFYLIGQFILAIFCLR